MGLIESILALFFGKKKPALIEVSLEEAHVLFEKEITADDAALTDFASKKFAEIRHLISSLSKNSAALEEHQIKVDEGNKTYRQIVSTSQKNLARHLKGISNKLMPPQKIDAASVRAYTQIAIRAVSTDLMPYWKNIALARLMLRDEVKTIGESLQELAAILEELHSAAFSKKHAELNSLKMIFEEIKKKESEISGTEQKASEFKRAIFEKENEITELERKLSSKSLSADAQQLKRFELEALSLEEKKAEIVSRFNSEIAPLEKVLKRLFQISESSDALTQKEKELIPMLLSSPFSAFVADPNGASCKSLFQKAVDFISSGKIQLKVGEDEKKIAALKSFLAKDFFTEYFWETNKLQAELQKAQRSLAAIGVSSEIKSMNSDILSAKKLVEKLKESLYHVSAGDASIKMQSLKTDAAESFLRSFEGKYSLKP